MTERVAANLSLESAMRRAVERDEFVLPIPATRQHGHAALEGVEALIRWRNDGPGCRPPHFIPLWRKGLILEAAHGRCEPPCPHRDWVGKGIRAPRVAVNVSGFSCAGAISSPPHG